MTRLNKIFFSGLLLAFCIVLFTTCKKYPENKFLECVNPRKVLEGQWYFNGYFVNDADSTMQHLKVFNPNASNPNSITLFVTQSGSNKDIFNAELKNIDIDFYGPWCSCISHAYEYEVSFTLQKNKKDLYIGIGGGKPNIFSWEEQHGFWKIRKLTKKEFVIENELNKKHRIEFIK